MQKNTQNLVLIILFSIICVIIFSQNLSNRTRQQIEYNERYQEYDIEKSKDDDTYNADNQNKLLSWAEIKAIRKKEIRNSVTKQTEIVIQDVEAGIRQKPYIKYNKKFIFHNKLPKCGSTTVGTILEILSSKHNFNLIRNLKHDAKNNDPLSLVGKSDEYGLAKVMNKTVLKKSDKTLLLRHHFPFDFSKFKESYENPTYINIIRDPVGWFQSHFYFKRNGRKLDNFSRSKNINNKEQDMDINQCVEWGHEECTYLQKEYFRYIAGDYITDEIPERNGKQFRSFRHEPLKNSEEETTIRKTLEASKYALLYRFYTVGILEDLKLSLDLFEVMMPEYFEGASGLLNSKEVLASKEDSASLNIVKLTEKNKQVLRNGLLRYEYDLYEFAKVLFYRQVKEHLEL